MKGKINKRNFAYLIMFLLLFIMHLLMNANFCDDVDFRKIGLNNIGNRVVWNYYNWSSRSVIEFVGYHLYYVPSVVWKLIDCFMYTLIAWCISDFIGEKYIIPIKDFTICALVLCYPVMHMATAGWIVTSVNYTWAFALGFYSFRMIKKIYYGEKIKGYEYLLYLLATIYGSNAEQVACVMFAFSFLFCIYFFYLKRLKIIQLIQWIIITGMLVYKVTAPNNAIVIETGTRRYFKEYGMLNIIDKLYLGFTATVEHYFSSPNVVFLLFLGTMAVGIFIKYNEKIYRIIGIFPFIFCILVSVLNPITKLLFPAVNEFFNSSIRLDNFYSWSAYFPLLLQVFLILIIIINTILLGNKKEEKIFLFLLVSAAFAARMVVSFSSTIYASGMRTHNTTYFIFIFLCGFYLRNCAENIQIIGEKDKIVLSRYKNILLVLCKIILVTGISSYINTLLSL